MNEGTNAGKGLTRIRSGQPPGFRIDRWDVVFLAILGGLSLLIWHLTGLTSLAGLPSYVGLTFFLFCNVFRIGNRLEAFWYVPFTTVAAYFVWAGNLDGLWWAIAFFLEPLKWLLITWKILKGPYVGIFSRLSPKKSASE